MSQILKDAASIRIRSLDSTLDIQKSRMRCDIMVSINLKRGSIE
jgi:hypothetical protein